MSLCHFPVENVPMIVSMYILLPLMDSSACISDRNIHTSWRSKCPYVSILSSLRGRAGLAAHNTHPSVVVPKILKSLINCNYLRSTNHRFFLRKLLISSKPYSIWSACVTYSIFVLWPINEHINLIVIAYRYWPRLISPDGGGRRWSAGLTFLLHGSDTCR